MNSVAKYNVLALLLAVLLVYLFVTAPPPLEEHSANMKTISTQLALHILQNENARVRALYTKEIVGQGKKQKIAFSEHWKQTDVHAGLLPAQFLRQTARYLERSRVRLGLFLGSDYAINKANLFEAEQKIMFENIKADKQPLYFFYPDGQRYIYMFPDIAVVKPCVDCHNDHEDSPKNDWKLDDVMGATTWMYPDAEVDVETFLKMLATLRDGFKTAYMQFLKEIQNMQPAPEIGSRWPRDGFYVPDVETFMREVSRRSSADTLNQLILSLADKTKAGKP